MTNVMYHHTSLAFASVQVILKYQAAKKADASSKRNLVSDNTLQKLIDEIHVELMGK